MKSHVHVVINEFYKCNGVVTTTRVVTTTSSIELKILKKYFKATKK